MSHASADASLPGAGEQKRKVDYRERCAVAANMHAYEAQKWRRKLDADPTDPDAPDEIADETQRSRDMNALADALDALAAAEQPIRALYDEYLRECEYMPCEIAVDTLDLRALLDCISTLLGAEHER